MFTKRPKKDTVLVSDTKISGVLGNQYLNKVVYKIDESIAKLTPEPKIKDFEKKT